MYNELWGQEFDWFAVDSAGHIGLFSSAGSGLVPEHVRGFGEPYEHVATLLEISRLEHTWQDAARAGLHAYDCRVHRGPYRRVGRPEAPLRFENLPEEIRAVVGLARYCGIFGRIIRYNPADWAAAH